MTVTHFDNKEDWLAYRIANKEDYYGASEAAKACGLLPWEGCSPADMYMEKVGLKPIKDISEKSGFGTALKLKNILQPCSP